MSRVRNTLDTVSKAVSGTHTELLSKIARLKPNVLKSVESAETVEEAKPKPEESTVTTTNDAPTTATTPKPSLSGPSIPTSGATFDEGANGFTHPPSSTRTTVAATILTVRELKYKRLPAVKTNCVKTQEEPPLSDIEKHSTTSTQPTALFHPSSFSANLDETYNNLAHHINSYFGTSTSTKTQDKNVDNVHISPVSSQGPQTSDLVPVSGKTESAAPLNPSSSKKGLGHYLSYSAPTVQAFVGNYIAPYVPKFRTGESKGTTTEEKKLEDVSGKQVEATVSKEQKAAEEKAKKLLLQREKVCLQKALIHIQSAASLKEIIFSNHVSDFMSLKAN